MQYRLKAAWLGAALALSVTPSAWACATCQCGDYTLTLMGVEKSFEGRLRFGLDYLSREEDQGSGLNRETITEDSVILGASYSFTRDFSVAVRVPYTRKESNAANLGHEQAEGLGDTDLLAKLTLGSAGETAVRHLWGVQAGLRVPTSSEQKTDAGVAVSTDAQPGTGTWAPSVGAWYSYFRYPQMLSISLVGTNPDGSGYQGLNPGQALLATLTGQYALTQDWSVQLGLENRWAARNRFYGTADDNSGGQASFIVPGLLWSPATDVLVHLAGQIPLIDHLNGVQKERGDIRVGIAFDFAR